MSLRETLEYSLASLAESALNQGLSLDPATQSAVLEQLSSPIGLQVEPPGLSLTLSREGERVRLAINAHATPSAVVSGTPLAMVALALGDNTPLQQQRVTIEGEQSRVEALTRTLSELDPDLESALAGVMGDVPAHILGRRLRRILAWTQQANDALMANVEDYIQEEAGIVPPRNEAEAYFEDIDALEARTEALEARIEALSQQSGPESS